MTSVAQAALDAADCGISVWPPKQDGTKSPDGAWKQGQAKRATAEQIAAWYATGRTGVGFITGAVSGNLEVIDFDDRSIWAEFQRLCADAGLAALLAKVSAGYCEHSPNGAHLLYRCSQIEPNQKLAKRPDGTGWKSIIETRGEGGYIIAAPSHGGVNLKGPYTLVSGGPSTIVTITPEERRALFDVARIFDESPRQVATEPRLAVSAAGRPGDDYCARVTWDEVLCPHGWVKAGGRLGVTSWRRPGKDHGISATTGHAGTDLLYVFSSSTCFESERGYNKFSAYCLLNHNGDFAAAAHALSMLGYGLEVPEDDSDVDLSLLLARGNKPAEPPTVESLLRVPGMIGDFTDWVNATSHRKQPVLALAAGIAAMSAIIGRKVRTETDLMSNIYIFGVGHTGCGKERAREAIEKLFFEVGASSMLGSTFASDSAVESAIIDKKACLFMMDEIGAFLGSVKSQESPSYLKAVVTTLTKVYTSSSSVYRRKAYAMTQESNKKDGPPQEVERPCLSLYCTTVPSNLYGSISKAQMQDGFLPRLLVFESTDPRPDRKWIDVAVVGGVPRGLVDGFTAWHKAPHNADPAGNLDAVLRPNPRIVRASAAARGVYDDLEATMDRLAEQARKQGLDQGPYTRVGATAQKLALIRACGLSVEAPEINESDAEWGCNLAWRLTVDFLAKIESNVSENKTEENIKRVLEIIRKAGQIDHSKLLRTVWFTDSQGLKRIAETLIESGVVEPVRVGADESSGKKGRLHYRFKG